MYKLFKIIAEININKDGRRTLPIPTGYRPGFKFGNNMQTSGSILLLNREDLKPGEKDIVEIRFISNVLLGNINTGTEFRFYEGPFEIGRGKVVEIVGWIESF